MNEYWAWVSQVSSKNTVVFSQISYAVAPNLQLMELEKNKEMEALESKGTGFAYFETCVENVMNYCPHFIQCEDYQTIQAYTFLNIMCKKKKISILVCQSCMPHYCLGIHNTLAAAS